MCTGAEIGLILAGTGAATNMVNQQGAARRQDKLAAQGIRQQQEYQRQANARVNQEVAGLQQSNPQAEQAQMLDAYMNALRATQPGVDSGFQAPGAVNPRFAEQVMGQQQDMASRAGGIARDMSVMDAATLQRLREGMSQNRAVSDVGSIGRNASGADYINRLRVASVRPNPWIGAAGNVMQGVGTAMALMPPPSGVGGVGGFNIATQGTAGVPASAWEQFARVPRPFG